VSSSSTSALADAHRARKSAPGAVRGTSVGERTAGFLGLRPRGFCAAVRRATVHQISNCSSNVARSSRRDGNKARSAKYTSSRSPTSTAASARIASIDSAGVVSTPRSRSARQNRVVNDVITM